MGELLPVLGLAIGFGEGHDATDVRQQGDATFRTLFELLAHDRVTELAAASNRVALLATVIIKDVRRHFMRAFRLSNLLKFGERRWWTVWSAGASNQNEKQSCNDHCQSFHRRILS